MMMIAGDPTASAPECEQHASGTLGGMSAGHVRWQIPFAKHRSQKTLGLFCQMTVIFNIYPE